MRGTIIEHQPKQGKKTFGYSLFLGRDETGKQVRQLRRGFKREKDAQDADVGKGIGAELFRELEARIKTLMDAQALRRTGEDR